MADVIGSVITSVFARSHVDGALKSPHKSKGCLKSYLAGDRTDGELAVGKKLFCLVNAKFVYILVYSDPHLLLKDFAEIVLGKTDLITYSVDIEFIFIIFGNIFQSHIYNGLLSRSDFFYFSDIVPEFIKRIKNTLDQERRIQVEPSVLGGRLRVVKDIIQFHAAVEYIYKRVAQNDVVLCTDKVVKKFCMASTNDEVIKYPVP